MLQMLELTIGMLILIVVAIYFISKK